MCTFPSGIDFPQLQLIIHFFQKYMAEHPYFHPPLLDLSQNGIIVFRFRDCRFLEEVLPPDEGVKASNYYQKH